MQNLQLLSITALSTLVCLTCQRFVFPDDHILHQRKLSHKFEKLLSRKHGKDSSEENSSEELRNEIDDSVESYRAACRDNAPFCSDPDHYPESEIKSALKRQHKTMAGILKPVKSARSSVAPVQLQGRQGLVEREWHNLCDTNTTFIFPRAARNMEGEHRFLVNIDTALSEDDLSEYQQMVRVTTCAGAGAGAGRCGGVAGLETRCRQEYAEHKLVALRGGELVLDNFSFPSCCSCEYSQARLL